ncbi:molybdenum ABC transporter, periplasmic molybdate-binding protein [Desulfitobacterium dichloroeliminans LMG P-21439]|uniref:Molybdenum ABC transporter, periplasmic molybdate-binding protein n=1 Tax=Desulfitobacterium dichloroeliminans (strain LMG P-21439 / DCA1) TaxID=871963 RepID=L0FBU9_DESDL|nr:molybdate ABC transporter substrate-binding protein [Desulfitobacterium dichloroeliminans]AGA70692.1 molybdenum ABC transporter, periplasmic molybdate-binding protein [Desulfitobacterium dichloroeliminans LMG P-21439]
MKRFFKTMVIGSLILPLLLVGCGASGSGTSDSNGAANAPREKPTELTISVAASLKDSMGDLQTLYEGKNTQIKLIINYAGSGTLQKQIEEGAPADLFISAGKSQVDALIEKNLMIKESVVNLLGNELVLVVGADNTEVKSIQGLSKDSVVQIGIGTPESVPAGKYAKEAFTSLELWGSLQPKFVMAKDVSQVLNYVETGNAEAGVVYKSDAQRSTKAKVVESFPADSHKPIIYPAGIVSATKHKAEAEAFLTYLQSTEAQDIFFKYGFKIAGK